MDRVYFQPWWLFSHENVSPGTSYALQNPRGTTDINDWRHLSQQIQGQESSAHHVAVYVIYEQWRNRGTIEEALHEFSLEKTNVLQNFGKTCECYVDVSKVQLTFSRIKNF